MSEWAREHDVLFIFCRFRVLLMPCNIGVGKVVYLSLLILGLAVGRFRHLPMVHCRGRFHRDYFRFRSRRAHHAQSPATCRIFSFLCQIKVCRLQCSGCAFGKGVFGSGLAGGRASVCSHVWRRVVGVSVGEALHSLPRLAVVRVPPPCARFA